MKTKNHHKIIEILQQVDSTSYGYLRDKTKLTDRGLSRSLKPLVQNGHVIREKIKGSHPVYKIGVFDPVMVDCFNCQHIVVKYLLKSNKTRKTTERALLQILNEVRNHRFLTERYRKLAEGKHATDLDSKSLQVLAEIFDLSGFGFTIKSARIIWHSVKPFRVMRKDVEEESRRHHEKQFMIRDGISRTEARKKLEELRKKSEIQAKKEIAIFKEKLNKLGK